MINNYSIVQILIFLTRLLSFDADAMEVVNFDQQHFEYSVHMAQKYEIDKVKSMVIPHHLLASDLIANMYFTASSEEVKRIVLISPDHKVNSSRKALTSKKDWQFVSADKVYVDKLLELGFVYEDDQEIKIEHGINVHIPYIKQFFKNAKVVPLALSREITKKELDELIKFLGDDCMIVASVDFSHYLNLEEANLRDQMTLEILKQRDYHLLFGKGDAYYDSQAALYTVFSHAERYAYETHILDRSNSAYYTSENIPETTSYFVIAFK